MSRGDSQDFDYPPGLGFLRGVNGDRENMGGYIRTPESHTTGGFGPLDHRLSTGLVGYGTYVGSIPRSIGLQEREFGIGTTDNWSAPNRHTPSSPVHIQPSHFSSFNHNHHNRTPPTPSHLPQQPAGSLYHSRDYNSRNLNLFRQAHQSPSSQVFSSFPPNTTLSRSTLWWGELEPWMDEEYAKQVCGLMGWDPVNVKVPHPTPDPSSGQAVANNPGYCFLTFPTPAHAASVIAQINGGANGAPITMPNSSKPFVLNWASSIPSSLPISSAYPSTVNPMPGAQPQYPKEYSIFVGDLAPETSNSDLVAVFRNPVLGLRNDREPKFIRPFMSCKSAKIMLDPVTGVSRGYGFVRFTEESDQQRALIEMHGLYCLSRPMRISPATAKFKPPITVLAQDLPQVQFPGSTNSSGAEPQPVTIALPLPTPNQTKSVSASIAATTSSNSSLNSNVVATSGSGSSLSAGSNSTNTLSSGTGSSASISSATFTSASPEELMNLPNNVLAQIAQQYANGSISPLKVNAGGDSIPSGYGQEPQVQGQGPGQDGGAPRYTISEESWKHHAQARAILGNLIGPNGEQLTSTDPYNTTVFVGGLSPLISEETLRTFFAPFGDIHYVKVPVGKHCGFVQFVRKADAERAIEKMQGFPVGGSRIRLSWGRSQYKAAQAAAQAAQAAAIQTQFTVAPPPTSLPPNSSMTQEQALQLLQKFSMQGYLGNGTLLSGSDSGDNTNLNGINSRDEPVPFEAYSSRIAPLAPPLHVESRQNRANPLMSFSPFSPDPNFYPENKRRDSESLLPGNSFPQLKKAYGSGFFPLQQLQTQDLQVNGAVPASNGDKVSPTTTRPPSVSRYGSFLDSNSSSFQVSRAPGRPEGPISRPSSGHTSTSNPSRAEYEGHEHDIQDLNGTLASLDLDQGHGSWQSPSKSSEDSSGSAQFRASVESSQKTSSSP